MNAKRIGGTAAVITLLASGVYFFLYLYWWEWNGAAAVAAIFVAAEVGFVGWLVSDRIRRVERRLDRMAATAQELGLPVQGVASSGLPGPKGNRETFIWCGGDGPAVDDLDAAVAAAVEADK